ncbi:transporter substrate-binding domain-containing protein [Chromobacterium alkanivorans]|uniref:substrate-binding periplasmic protein n=1 Tax=Chromobacterium alkanivorans TaxID=1071719 RepID=UPI0019689A85|nr:transporter substrate-binding domain-containing protein [Chromobacterium alkanivorans]MBN3005883.1 transporter substrate-binding domain-containing protein [Chromobacterium alkanivorans]
MPRLPAKLIAALVSAPAAASGLTILVSPQPPIIEVSADQQHVSGAAIDLMRALSQRAGLPFKFAPYPSARAVLLVQQTPDTCLTAARFPEREALFRWSEPVIRLRLVLLARQDEARDFGGVEQARQFHIGAVRGTAVASRLKQQGWTLDESADAETNLRKLQLGRIDLLATLDVGIQSLADKMKMATPRVALVVNETDIYFACHPQLSDDAMRRLNRAILAMKADGSLKAFNLK